MKGFPAKLIIVYNDKRAQMTSVNINMAMTLDFEVVKSGSSALRRLLTGPDASATVSIDSANAWETTAPSEFDLAFNKGSLFENFESIDFGSPQAKVLYGIFVC